MKQSEKILAVPTNVITGFLGVGKTSAIMHLLSQKPTHERWAVLVNEFGEIGVDGALLVSNKEKHPTIFIEEVAGGCMCCTSSVPMGIALNKLLKEAKPDRLLIEPTGLGHPEEVLQLLSNEHYQEVLDIQKTITLVDARNLADSRYTSHDTFNQQIALADIIVGNKSDLYQNDEKKRLNQYIAQHNTREAEIYFVLHGQIANAWLLGKSALEEVPQATHHHKHEHDHGHDHDHHHSHHEHDHQINAPLDKIDFPASGIISAINQGEGYHSVGWRISQENTFHYEKIIAFINTMKVVRLKAVIITDQGCYRFNKADNEIEQAKVDTISESRLEIINQAISHTQQKSWHQALTAAIEPHDNSIT